MKSHPENNLSKHFHDGNGKPQNIGILLGKPSKGLVDIDLDNFWSVQYTTHFLPETNAVFGRKSKRRSHYLYYCSDAKTERFQSSEMIVEIRAERTQTVFPGSVHVSGEPVTWDANGEPSHISFEELRSAVGKLAAASLISEYWVDTKRHDLSLCVSGALLTNGFSFEDTHFFIKAICSVTNDQEISDRLKAVQTTYERIQNEQNVIGFPRLTELTDSKTVSLLRRWLNFSRDNESETETIQTDNGLENYRLTDQGLFYIFYEITRGGKVKEVETFICSPLKVIATEKDADDGE